MTYRVYSGPQDSQMVSALEKERLLYKEFETLDNALSWARHVNDDERRVTLLIEGDDGTHMAKNEIVSALRHSEYDGVSKSSH
jgi:hypothetical protein